MKDFSIINKVYGNKIGGKVAEGTGKMGQGLHNSIAVLGQVIANGQPAQISSPPTNFVPVKLKFDPRKRVLPK
ncbi:MAG: hypothetical protein WC666_01465 [Candidatus Paceibacterota bacterium]|jgi:hypothetical protein